METLKDLRKQSKKTLAEVADVLGVTVRAVLRYENGTRQMSLSQILLLAKFYECSERNIILAQLNSCQQVR